MSTGPDQPDYRHHSYDPGPRKLFRSDTNRKIAGVCGGLAEYFDIDPTLIRLAIVVAFFLGAGAVLPLYVIAWIVLPEA